MLRAPSRAPLFPYTTLFRSECGGARPDTGLLGQRAGMSPDGCVYRQRRPRQADGRAMSYRSEEHTSELQSLRHLVCRLLLEKKKRKADHSKKMQTQKLKIYK